MPVFIYLPLSALVFGVGCIHSACRTRRQASGLRIMAVDLRGDTVTTALSGFLIWMAPCQYKRR
jgi:hypothetical protein